MFKVMNLDMFCFDYEPVFSENEKVIYKNGQIVVLFQNKERALVDSNISNIKLDTLFAQRIGQEWSNDEIIKTLNSIDSNGIIDNNKYSLCIIKPEDEINVAYDYMVDVLSKLNYDGQSFSYVAHGE